MKRVKAIKPSANGAASYQPRATPWEQSAGWPQALKGRPIKAPSRQKTPVIVPHQGKSRHPIKLPMTPLNIQDPATGTPPINPPFAPSRLCDFALKPQQSRHIKATNEKSQSHQTKRQRRGLIPAQGNALGTIRRMAPSPEGATHQGTIKAENPCNRASSRQIKASDKTPHDAPQHPRSGNRHPSHKSALCAFATLRLCVKNQTIKAYQGEPPIIGARPFPGAATAKPASRIAMPNTSRQHASPQSETRDPKSDSPGNSSQIKVNQGCFRITPFAPVHHPAPRLVAPLFSSFASFALNRPFISLQPLALIPTPAKTACKSRPPAQKS